MTGRSLRDRPASGRLKWQLFLAVSAPALVGAAGILLSLGSFPLPENARGAAIAAFAGALVVVWLLSLLFVTVRVAGRLQGLHRAVNAAESGSAELQDVALRGNDEISAIARALKQTVNENSRLEWQQKDFEQRDHSLTELIDAAPVAMIELDLDGTVRPLWNRAAERMLGWKAHEVIGERLPWVHPATETEAEKLLEQVRQGGIVDGAIVRRRRKDGSSIDCRIFAAPLRDRDGNIDGNISVLIDSTERVKAVEALMRSEKSFQKLYEETPAMMYELDREGRIVVVSNKWLETLGYSREEVIGRRDTDFLTDADRRYATEEGFPEFHRTGHRQNIPYQFVARNGRLVDVLLSAFWIRDDSGAIDHGYVVIEDVTERNRANEALRKSERRFRELYEKTPAMMHEIDEDGRIVVVSNRWLETLGYGRDEVIGRYAVDFLTEESRQYALETGLKELFKSSLRQNIPYQFVTKNGRVIDVLLSAICVRDDNGKFEHAYVVFEDVSERNQALEALKKSEARFRALYEDTPALMHAIDSSGRLMVVSNKWLETLGYSREEVIGRKSTDFLTEESRRFSIGTVMPEFFRTGSCKEVPYQMVTRDGRVIDILLSAICERDADGNIEHSYAVLEDITERKKASDALLESENRLRDIIDSASDLIWEVDPDGKFTFCSGRTRDILGYEPDELLGTSRYDLMKAEEQKEFRDFIEGNRPAESSRENFEHWVTGKNGRRICLSSNGVAYRDRDGKFLGYRGADKDVTAKRQAEQALTAERRQLKVANEELLRRNEELNNFTSVASHDLQEPLRKLTAFSNLLIKDLGDDLNENARTDLEFILDAAKRMEVLIQDLLLLARSARREMEIDEISVADCVNEAIQALSLKIAESAAEILVDPLPDVVADKRLLTQLFQNLISNALKFVKDGPAKIRITFEQADGSYVFGVKDNGIGIDPEYQDKIFRPFKRLHGQRQFPGTGVGLAIVDKVIERHGGKIWVESEPGKGSHFKFTLGAPTSGDGESYSI